MAGAYVVVRYRKSWSGTVTVETFGPYTEDVAEKVRARAALLELRRPALLQGTVHVSELKNRVTE